MACIILLTYALYYTVANNIRNKENKSLREKKKDAKARRGLGRRAEGPKVKGRINRHPVYKVENHTSLELLDHHQEWK
jgi:hypothetical protein